ncbi:MAG TPA: hypothetical protein VM716_06830 [Gemmatimonadales bacterium]|nr:hypothetical protein [Gemmatimonadales bacterium]
MSRVFLARHPLSTIAAEDRPYSMLAWFYASAGEPERARRLIAEYERAVPEGLRRGNPFRHEALAALALATGRIDDAIRSYRAFYDESGCAACGLYDLGRAYEQAKLPDSARLVYERAVTTPWMSKLYEVALTLAPTYRRLGELYETAGDRGRALQNYSRFVDLWRNADPDLRTQVRDVKARMARLNGTAEN